MQKRSSKNIGHSTMNFRQSSSLSRVKQALKQLQKGYLKYFLIRGAEDGQNGVNDQHGDDLREGHFSVVAMSNGEAKKFLVALNYLRYPPFVKLLEAAEREFGFDQQGVLVIPCNANELQRILQGKSNQ